MLCSTTCCSLSLHIISCSAPDFFDPTTIARHLGDNWALKSSNLRKLVRNLQDYYHEALQKDADFASIPLAAVSKQADAAGIAVLVELVAAAAVTCRDKGTYVQRIMTTLSPQSQVEMKAVLQESLARLSDFHDDTEAEEADTELVFDQDNKEAPSLDEGDPNLISKNLFTSHVAEGLEKELQEARREIAALKSHAAITADDNSKAEQKLRAVVQDLQDRLVNRQDELHQLEEDLRQATTELEEVQTKFQECKEEKTQLADDLDVATAKAQQLHKAEATVMAYKKKLEGVGAMNQQMTDLEDQAAKYLRQVMELETQVQKSAALEKTVAALQEQVAYLEKDKKESVTSTVSSATEIADLKARLQAAETAKKLYQDELTELRVREQNNPHSAAATTPTSAVSGDEGLSLKPSSSAAEMREKMTRLEIEKENLEKELQEWKKKAEAAAAAGGAAAAGNNAQASAEVARLTEELERKEKENAKIAGDKDKLENYTKRTLAKFQEKYLVALQECKAKLKEKQDKIESLESRSASERTAQKREERLLSSTIYELGLAIMQNRLKDR